MPTILTTGAVEESTFVVTLTFTDEDDNAVTPGTLTWSLFDSGGSIVNSRQGVNANPASEVVNIVLQGDDLAILSASDDRMRMLTVSGTYDSDLGNDLPIQDEVVFQIIPLLGVT